MKEGIRKLKGIVEAAYASMPFLAWPRLSPKFAVGEVSAGLTVALVVIPQSVAYATIAGMPLVTGIYASFIPALVALLLAASPRLSVGPTALCALLVGASLTGKAVPGSAQWVELTVWLALLSGMIQLFLGFMRMGWLLKLVSSPVMMGFTQAAAVIIVFSQVRALFGAEGHIDFWNQVPDYSLPATAFGVSVLAILFIFKRWAPKIPMMLIVLIASALISWLTDYAGHGGAVVGALPSGLPEFYLPSLPTQAMLKSLIFPAVAIALVGFLETASSARIDHQLSGERWNENQDLLSQGASKIAAAFSGTLPISSSFSRSALNIFAGAKSGWAGLVTIVFVGIFLIWLTPYLFHVPQSVLAAVVIAAVSGLIRPKEFVLLWKVSRAELITALVTLIVTFVSAPDIYWGILTGIGMQIGYSLTQRFRPRIVELGLFSDGTLRDRKRWQLPALSADTFAVRMDADLDFISARVLEQAVMDHVSAHRDTRHVCVLAQSMNQIDATGVEIFSQMRRALADRRIVLHLCGLKLQVEKRLRRARELPGDEPWPYLRLYRTEAAMMAELTRPDPGASANLNTGLSRAAGAAT